MNADLPPAVRHVTERAVSLLDDRLPGYLDGLYLHGSLCWGEFFAASDIDFVATTTRRPNERDIALLRQIHGELAGDGPVYDGFYLPADDLTQDPTLLPLQPSVLGGDFAVAHHPDATMVTWHELAERGITVHGPPIEQLDIFTSQEVLRLNTRANLQSYWLARTRSLEGAPEHGLTGGQVAPVVLGVLRLHRLLVEGTLTPKSAAGRWGARVLPAHRPIIEEALAWREQDSGTGGFGSDLERRRATLALLTDVLHRHDLDIDPAGGQLP